MALIGNGWINIEAVLNAGSRPGADGRHVALLQVAALVNRLIITSEDPEEVLAEITVLNLHWLPPLGNPTAQAACELHRAALCDSI